MLTSLVQEAIEIPMLQILSMIPMLEQPPQPPPVLWDASSNVLFIMQIAGSMVPPTALMGREGTYLLPRSYFHQLTPPSPSPTTTKATRAPATSTTNKARVSATKVQKKTGRSTLGHLNIHGRISGNAIPLPPAREVKVKPPQGIDLAHEALRASLTALAIMREGGTRGTGKGWRGLAKPPAMGGDGMPFWAKRTEEEEIQEAIWLRMLAS